MESTNEMRKLASVVKGVYDLRNGEIAVIQEGKLRIYCTSQKLIAQKMEELDSMEKVWTWLKEKQMGQTICFIETGKYYSDNLVIEVANSEATLYVVEEGNLKQGAFFYDSFFYSTVTDFARFLGLSTSKPFPFEI